MQVIRQGTPNHEAPWPPASVTSGRVAPSLSPNVLPDHACFARNRPTGRKPSLRPLPRNSAHPYFTGKHHITGSRFSNEYQVESGNPAPASLGRPYLEPPPTSAHRWLFQPPFRLKRRLRTQSTTSHDSEYHPRSFSPYPAWNQRFSRMCPDSRLADARNRVEQLQHEL